MRLACPDGRARRIFEANFAALFVEDGQFGVDRTYRIGFDGGGSALVTADDGPVGGSESFAGLLFLVEKDLTVRLQRLRADLLFFHAAALEWRGKAYLLAAESGAGKSTTAWGLLHHGFRYLSDELAPIDLAAMCVLPYPHALCLKRRPPEGFPLPNEVVDLGETLHVPVRTMPAEHLRTPTPIGGVFVLRYEPDLPEPIALPMKPSEAVARLYPNVLNALAHPGKGLDALLRIVERVPCMSLRAARLGPTCELIAALAQANATGAH